MGYQLNGAGHDLQSPYWASTREHVQVLQGLGRSFGAEMEHTMLIRGDISARFQIKGQ